MKQATTFHENHFSPSQIAKSWGFSVPFIRELFRREQGVILVDRPEQTRKRGYATMRIPQSIADRVYTRLTTRVQ